MDMRSISPATGEEFARVPLHDAAEVARRLAAADAARAIQRRTPIEERAARLHRAADILEREKQRWGELMTREMGKPILAAVAEAEKCAWACRHYAEHGAAMLADEARETDAKRAFVRYQPIGIVLAVMPWNFPFWQVFRFAAPSLLAGNVGLLKHASNVPQCALAIEEILGRAGFDEGQFQALMIPSGDVQRVIEDPRVRAVTLTGSEPAGAAVAAAAGKAIKKTVLELGGSDPYVVMPSADIDAAADTAVKARAINNGQSCIAAKRFIIHERVYDAFVARFVRGLEALVVGDPLDPATQLGPLATESILEDLERQVDESVTMGATLLTGGKRLERPGFYYAATALANDTRFGLGSAAWTRDPAEQRRFADELEAGLVFINAMVASDPRLPFGGVKASGYGRELDVVGIREFVNIKAVSIADEGDVVE